MEIKRRQLQEVSFSGLTPQEENQLYTYDTYFEHDEAKKSFCVAGKEITAKLLAEVLHIKECQSMATQKMSCRYVWKTKCEYLSTLN